MRHCFVPYKPHLRDLALTKANPRLGSGCFERHHCDAMSDGDDQEERLRERPGQAVVASAVPRDVAIPANWSKAAWRSSTISAAISSGAGRFSESSSDSSRSQKMSRDALSLA